MQETFLSNVAHKSFTMLTCSEQCQKAKPQPCYKALRRHATMDEIAVTRIQQDAEITGSGNRSTMY